jgi:hypothetical protein
VFRIFLGLSLIVIQDTLEQIIDDCMWVTELPSGNGGYWEHYNEYAEGWFYNVNLPNRRGIEDIEARADNVTIDRTVYLGFDENGKVTGVAHDFRIQPDGTIKDVATGAK